jgi:hypothetical protein
MLLLWGIYVLLFAYSIVAKLAYCAYSWAREMPKGLSLQIRLEIKV